jgi:hypothetical protein
MPGYYSLIPRVAGWEEVEGVWGLQAGRLLLHLPFPVIKCTVQMLSLSICSLMHKGLGNNGQGNAELAISLTLKLASF